MKKTLLLSLILATMASSSQAGLYQFWSGNTTPEQAQSLEQLRYAEVACDNATRNATDPAAIQQAFQNINRCILAIDQYWPLKYDDVVVWDNMVLYQPIGNGRFNWRGVR